MHELYQLIGDAVTHEHGRARLSNHLDPRIKTQVLHCIQSEQDLLVWLDVVELALRGAVDSLDLSDNDRYLRRIKIAAHEAVSEVNERFRRAGFGYRYEHPQILRIDNELLHQEATLPALSLLSDLRFAGADEEFRNAHDHLKAGEYRDCAVDALNAVESTMKSICDAKGWKYERGARASDLIKILRREKLFPEFADQSFDHLIATLKSYGAEPDGWAWTRGEAGRGAGIRSSLRAEPCGLEYSPAV